MENELKTSGLSSGTLYLGQGYIEYALSVIRSRAISDYRDGLKPVQRRIVQIVREGKSKGKDFAKCSTLAGNVLALNPHTDDAVYQAMVLMADIYGMSEIPLLAGYGNFSKVTSTDPPAAKRYTEAKLTPYAEDFFREVEGGIRMIPNFDGKRQECEVLAASYPYVLIRPTSGIAVGFATNIPSFNFADVCNLVKEYIKDGKCSTVIAPDFKTGGYYIRNNSELHKLMTTGKARLKLRGKYNMRDSKNIEVEEIPYGKTVQGLVKQINDNDKPFSFVRNAYDSSDYEHPSSLTIELTNKDKVEETMFLISKYTDFQTTFSANMTMLIDGVPKTLGVWEVIKEWVEWRKGVVRDAYKLKLSSAKIAIAEAQAFMTLVNNREKCLAFVETVAKNGRAAGRKYIRDNFTPEEIPDAYIEFVSSRSLPSYNDGGSCKNTVATGSQEVAKYQAIVDNPSQFISNQMDEFIRQYSKSCVRHTEILDNDYDFDELTDSEIKDKASKNYVDTSTCYFSLCGDGFLKKTRVRNTDSSVRFQFSGKSNDTLIAFDKKGRLLRIFAKDIPVVSPTDIGVYLPKYLNIEDPEFYVTWIGQLGGQTLMLLYKDGNVGFVDTNEWIGNTRNVKVLENGIASSSADQLGAVIEDVPQVLEVMDTKGNFAWIDVDNLKRKDRRAKTRAFNMRKNASIASYSYCTKMDLLAFPSVTKYCGSFAKPEAEMDENIETFTPVM